MDSKFVHLRLLTQTNQCEFVVPFNTEFHGVSINEEMHFARQVTDTLGSLIDHTRNKLIKYINDKLAEGQPQPVEQKREQNYDIPISFQRETGHYILPTPRETKLEVLLTQDHTDTLVEVLDQKFKLLINPPVIKSMLIPTILYADFKVQPLRFFGLYTYKNLSEFTWYKSKDKSKWIKVGTEYEYKISKEDIGYYLKVVCLPVSDKHIKGPIAEAISERVVDVCPKLPKCPFEDRHVFTKKVLKGKCFRFMTYNTLSKRYTEMNSALCHCPVEALAIDYRKQLIWKEIKGYKADIICLQELDKHEYENYFKPKFTKLGFNLKFQKKGGTLSEGLFFGARRERFKILSYQHLVFAKIINNKDIFASLYAILRQNNELHTLFMKQSTSLQIFVLKCIELDRIIVVGNTHLYYHPDATAVRLIQTHMVTLFLTSLREELVIEWKDCPVDVIFCGDLNSSPDGAVYSFLCDGKIPPDNEYALQISENGHANFSHQLNFISACRTPKYTNYTYDYKNCLDYIFIQDDRMKVDQIVPLPEEDLEQYIALPNEVYPSDHIALVVDLEFKDLQ